MFRVIACMVLNKLGRLNKDVHELLYRESLYKQYIYVCDIRELEDGNTTTDDVLLVNILLEAVRELGTK